MRLMLKFTIPVEKGNEAAASGEMGRAMEALVDRLKPEASYFMLEDGKRGGIIIFETTDPTQLVQAHEPFFAKLNAAISTVPVLTWDEVRKGLPK